MLRILTSTSISGNYFQMTVFFRAMPMSKTVCDCFCVCVCACVYIHVSISTLNMPGIHNIARRASLPCSPFQITYTCEDRHDFTAWESRYVGNLRTSRFISPCRNFRPSLVQTAVLSLVCMRLHIIPAPVLSHILHIFRVWVTSAQPASA